MKKDEQTKYGILIKKKDGVYIWASREGRKLTYTQSGIFHVFTAEDGSGIISIEDATALSPSFRPGSTPIRYGEHIRSGIGIISYIGAGEAITP